MMAYRTDRAPGEQIEHPTTTAEREGHRARQAGQSQHTNPFMRPKAYDVHLKRAWNAGWLWGDRLEC